MTRRLAAFLGAVALTFSLAACQDETPFSNSAETPEQPQLQPTNFQQTFGNLIAALNNINVQIDRLNALNDLTIGDITLVNVEDVLNNSLNQNNVEILNRALNRNNVEILNLRNVLNDNTVIVEVLEAADIAITDVIAINVLSGDVTIFHQ
jgi:hypothetical protein